MTVDFSEILDAFEFVSSVGIGENTAFLSKETGKIYWHSDWADDVEEIPDIEDSEEYIRIPEKKELDLGKPLVLKFARHHLPTIAIKFWRSSVGRVPMPASRTCWSTGTPSIGGTHSRGRPRKTL
ncbi:hypothetical protein [Rhizobium leguminosarum]|uniref:hypothetical protein n=1 Tax=Rhizobium leguminosarum TaxID=384 RepID=UPI001FEDC150|nr:hypothetical protein [Rhizobium leguminosarum]